MTEFLPFAVAVALVWKLVDFVKFVRAKDTNAWATQLAVWGAGIGVAFLLRESDFSKSLQVGQFVLGGLNAASTVLFGVALGSAASSTFDAKKAIDNNDTAATPPLIPESTASE